MFICDNGHEEIVHKSFDCPLCEARENFEVLQEMNDEIQHEYDSLKEKYDELYEKAAKHHPELIL